ncbi:conserved Plasmodium protein, unknown function [Plasmodium malariae]|uniref:Uncharacterized protein n=1 Tax=Plasmodium malariae TaxID=5858 RepID=A0A1A8WZK2_PLAMA|nr:conserved Plasmodium protein, unknown function [Plasmodium malariae]SBS97308.1 conserved Plasmodium protein, unknown function [Plasmodium malariae]SBT87739.1 conserved Plasmodium protein, unknown function [Plasmodium malariae]
MKRNKAKEKIKEHADGQTDEQTTENQHYMNFNENTKKWLYNKIEKNKILFIKEKYQTFLKSYEDRKNDVTKKYNINKYLAIFNNLILLFFITFDIFHNLLKLTFKNVKYSFSNPLYCIHSFKAFIKNISTYIIKLINTNKQLLLNFIFFVLREKKKIAKEINNFIYFVFNFLNLRFFKSLEVLYQYMYPRYYDIFKTGKLSKVFT